MSQTIWGTFVSILYQLSGRRLLGSMLNIFFLSSIFWWLFWRGGSEQRQVQSLQAPWSCALNFLVEESCSENCLMIYFRSLSLSLDERWLGSFSFMTLIYRLNLFGWWNYVVAFCLLLRHSLFTPLHSSIEKIVFQLWELYTKMYWFQYWRKGLELVGGGYLQIRAEIRRLSTGGLPEFICSSRL